MGQISPRLRTSDGGRTMIRSEPLIAAGIVEGVSEIRGHFNGIFQIPDGRTIDGDFVVVPGGRGLRLSTTGGETIIEGGDELVCTPTPGSDFVLRNVVIGIQFHWERKEDQRFLGSLRLVRRADGSLVAINLVPLEQYLSSVISSEMSETSPPELLRAHAITSRSWLVAMLQRKGGSQQLSRKPQESPDEITRWYSREDHDLFDVCADDHCQRYQGISKIVSPGAGAAVDATRGMLLVHDGEICDARYYKACGGITDEYQSAWEEVRVPYLTSIADGPSGFSPIRTEAEARRWIESTPDAYCNTHDPELLRQILPSFDQETADFFRWEVQYEREELEELLGERSGIDFGTLRRMIPQRRGPSGRIVHLRIEGSRRTVVVGKELEIRRWLSHSHLYSSAFLVVPEGDEGEPPRRFRLQGAGWGHGVGLCQIGAAVMATRGFSAEQIVRHYFPGSEVEKLY